MKMSWESIMSRICVRDILASTDIKETSFSQNSVDDIMCHAVTLMTSKLLRIYAFNRWGFWDVGGMGGCFFDLVGFECCVFFFWGWNLPRIKDLGGWWRTFFHMEHSPTWCLLDYREVAGGGDSICGSGLSGRRISVGYSVLGCLSDIEWQHHALGFFRISRCQFCGLRHHVLFSMKICVSNIPILNWTNVILGPDLWVWLKIIHRMPHDPILDHDSPSFTEMREHVNFGVVSQYELPMFWVHRSPRCLMSCWFYFLSHHIPILFPFFPIIFPTVFPEKITILVNFPPVEPCCSPLPVIPSGKLT